MSVNNDGNSKVKEKRTGYPEHFV